MNTYIEGVKGEELAKKFLVKNHYKIICQNYRTKIGEIDIIAKDKLVLVFIEVKERATDRFGLPREAITNHKQHKIRQVATQYLMEKRLFDQKIRFDCVEVLDGKVSVIKNAF